LRHAAQSTEQGQDGAKAEDRQQDGSQQDEESDGQRQQPPDEQIVEQRDGNARADPHRGCGHVSLARWLIVRQTSAG
jgi:hypothetical protein